jgi:hypothetical protein
VLLESDNADKDYYDDYMEIISSIKVAPISN